MICGLRFTLFSVYVLYSDTLRGYTTKPDRCKFLHQIRQFGSCDRAPSEHILIDNGRNNSGTKRDSHWPVFYQLYDISLL